ncbi:MAG: ATP-dependent Clp protease proteolytic subunit, partial [Acidimicrobiia bacterium]|nr:ATP-dependent Clp protease proteolytic subunit [Acidimicrobiia bacterium]
MRPPEDLLRARLFERGIVFLRGALDDAVAGDVAAQLMTLDASGDEPVQLHV